MADRHTRIRGKQILADSVDPSDLNANNSPVDGYVPSYDSVTQEFEWIVSGGTASGENLVKSINQTAHGFIVGNVLRFNGTVWVKAQADSATNAEAIGIVSSVTNDDNFILLYSGYISGLSSLTAGTKYYLSDTSAGALTNVEPTDGGEISKPLLIAVSTTAGYFFNWRGSTVITSLFELDGSGDLMPRTDTVPDSFFDLDGNDDIEPK